MSKEYIEREAVCKDCAHYCICKDTVADGNWDENAPKEVREMFSPSGCENYLPASDVEEVRHGEWMPVVIQENYFDPPHCDTCKCSACEYEIDVSETVYSYCPNCGAKMDGKGER